MTTPALVGLKCPQCSAPMKTIDDRRFACEHCGSETMLAAPQVDLDRVASDVARAARGVERGAAELSIPRLERERAELAAEYRRAKAEAARTRTRRALITGLIVLAFFAPLLGAAIERKAGAIGALAVLSIVALVFIRPIWRWMFGFSARHTIAIESIRTRFDDVERRIEAADAAARSL